MQVLAVSLFWTGAVLCNTVHVIVSGMVFLDLIHGSREADSIPAYSLIRSVQYALTKSFGSICYGSLFTAAVRTLRWEVFTIICISVFDLDIFFVKFRGFSFLLFFYQITIYLSDKGIPVKDWQQ